MCKMLRTMMFVSLLWASAWTVANGQIATGTYAYGTFDSKGLDTINVGSLNAHFSIPVFSKPGRGLPFNYQLSYDSSVWQIVSVSGQATWNPVQNYGWLAQTVVSTGYVSYATHTYVCDWPPPKKGSYWIYNTFVYHDPFGVSHSFGGDLEYDPTGCDSTLSSFTATANDGSGLTLNATRGGSGPTITQQIVARNGQKTMAPVGSAANGSTITDSNGNQVSVSAAGAFTDTTGATVMVVSGQAPNPVTLTYPTLTATASYTMKYTSQTVKTNFGCSNTSEYSATAVPLVSEIDLPDNSKYTFTYEATPGTSGAVTGRLATVTLPAGGTISYTYTGSNNGIVCSDGSAAGLKRILSNDPAGSTWTYVRTPASSTSHTDVTDGLGNHSAYDFVNAGNKLGQYYETNRSVYQGLASGTPVVSRHTCYNGLASPCTTTLFNLPITQIDTYETLDGIQTHGATSKFSTYGIPTERDDYDFGPTSRGALLRKEVWTHGGSRIDLVTEDDIYDGGGNLSGKTVYAYDGTTPTPSSGVPQHIAVSGPRGNLTSVTQYASSASAYTSTSTYEDTGSLLSSTTPSGTTTFSYDPTFTQITGEALPTPSSGVSLAISATSDTTNTGLPLTSTDPNSAQVSVPTYDSLLRPLEVDFTGGGKTTFSYSSTQVGQHSYQSSTVYSDTEVLHDGYARTSRTAVANGQSGSPWYQVDSCYDANGNIQFSSYPYQGTGWGTTKVCSGSGDTYTYDVLGRVQSITRGNGETVSYTYKGRAAQSTDENSVKHISQVDGLGRTTIVCEISSNSSMPSSGSPVSCGTDVPGTGFTTSYVYDLANHKTTTTQGAQTRIFQNDWLERPTSVQEPEMYAQGQTGAAQGKTTYSYAYNATGLVVTRSKPKANQASSTVLTTTTTQYDTLNRPVTVTYTDGTPAKYFYYDTNSYASWSSETTTNLKGRLAIASTATPTLLTSSLFSYDAMGRTTSMWECAPSICGTSYQAARPALTFGYDLAGNLTSEFDGASGSIAYGRSLAGEVTSITNQSYQGTGNPPNLVSSVINGPNGPISYSIGNGLSQYNSFDSLGRANGGWVCNGAPTYACSAQHYGYFVAWKGSQINYSSDDVTGQGNTYAYDEFNRLKSMTNSSGQQTYNYVYDRYGNRWQQNAPQGGVQPQYGFNTATNQITTSGYVYDAAGNMINDGFHTYAYDAEGNLTKVDGGSTAQYVYDALNRRVRVQTASSTYEYLFDYAGRRISSWLLNQPGLPAGSGIEGRIYWDGKQIAYRAEDGTTYFEHKDWLGTERMRTDYTGNVASTYASLPFGDGYTANIVKTYGDQDNDHFALLDYDAESATSHAQFRQYSNTEGRWMSPDPYSGSYDISNPQSLNRYAYVLDNPLFYNDPDGDDSDPSICYLLGYLCNTGGGGASYGALEQAAANTYVTVYPQDGDPSTYFLSTFLQLVPDQLGPGITVDESGNLFCSGMQCGYIAVSSFPGVPGSPGSSSGGGTGGSGGGTGGSGGSGAKSFPSEPIDLLRGAPNGNVWPGFSQQDGNCTTGSYARTMNRNPAILNCCQTHDSCYAEHRCNASSWLPILVPPGSCSQCNLQAAMCIGKAIIK